MTFTLTPQQKQIFEHMHSYQEKVHYKKVGEDMGLPKEGVHSQLKKLKDYGLVAEPESQYYLIAEKAQEKMEEAGEDTAVSMADVGLTAQQLFTKIGRTLGVNPERLQVIVTTIWQSGDPEDMDHVWKKLGRMMVSPEVKRQWCEAWQAYLGQDKPEIRNWQAPSVTEEKVIQEVEKQDVKRRVEEAAEEGPKKYVIDVRTNEVRDVGETVGLYSLKEAKELIGLRLMNQALGTGSAQAVATEKVSEILSALGPYVNKEGKEGAETMALMRELLEEKMNSALNELASRLPQDGGERKPWYEVLASASAAIKEVGPILAPILRDALGLPPPGSVAVNQGNSSNQSQAIQLIDQATGQPMTIDLSTLLSLRKFESEQKREDEKHKASMDMMSGLREFMGKIGTAANRLAGERR